MLSSWFILIPILSLMFIAFVYPAPVRFLHFEPYNHYFLFSHCRSSNLEQKRSFSCVFIFLAILFNPIAPVHLTREIWDLMMSLLFCHLFCSSFWEGGDWAFLLINIKLDKEEIGLFCSAIIWEVVCMRANINQNTFLFYSFCISACSFFRLCRVRSWWLELGLWRVSFLQPVWTSAPFTKGTLCRWYVQEWSGSHTNRKQKSYIENAENDYSDN